MAVTGEAEGEGGARRPARRARRPIDGPRLEDMALSYVARFSTTRAKLLTYLRRKLREHGWEGPGEPDLERIAGRLTELRYLDDAAFAEARGAGLTRRGYGQGRVRSALTAAGVSAEDGAAALASAEAAAFAAALAFARRRRLGPFAPVRARDKERERALASMVRAGHGFRLAARIIDSEPGVNPEENE